MSTEIRTVVIEEDEDNSAEYLLGGIIAYNASFAANQLADINNLVIPMMRQTERKIMALFNKYDRKEISFIQLTSKLKVTMGTLNVDQKKIFRKEGKELSYRYSAGLSKLTKQAVKRAIQPLYYGRRPPEFKENSKEFRAMESVAYYSMFNFIMASQAFYHEKIAFEVATAIRAKSSSGVAEYFGKQVGITERHTANKFGDNFRQDTNSLSRALLDRNGFDDFRWIYTDRAKEPRPFHKFDLAGNVYSIDEPPVIDEATGEKGHPGQLWGCKCMMQPVKRI